MSRVSRKRRPWLTEKWPPLLLEASALLVPLAFAVNPVVAMVLRAEPVFPLPGRSVARLVILVLLTISLAMWLLRRRCDIYTASNTLALPLLLLGLYPALFYLALSVATVSEGRFASVYLGLCSLVGILAYRTRGTARRSVHHALVVVATVFIVFSTSVMARAYWFTKTHPPDLAVAIESLVHVPRLLVPPGGRPDVYHLLLDGMGRPDVLAERYGMHLDTVLDQFRQLGFHVDAEQGFANYAQTHLSLASMLNMSYLDDLTAIQTGSSDRRPLIELIARARVPAILKQLGYRVEFIGSGYASNGAFEVADICDCPELWFGDAEIGTLSLTPLKALPVMRLGFRPHYSRIISVFNRFEQGASDHRPRYVFAHVMIPHPPFVVDGQGNFTNPGGLPGGGDASFFFGSAEQYITGYRAQASFALRRALLSATTLLAEQRRAGRDAVVIIHGDHGPRLGYDAQSPTAESGHTVLPVLMAIRTPGPTPLRTPPSSLVNVYRALLGDVLGVDIDVLPDRGYVSGFKTPYDTIAVERIGAR